jgi:hypothetical protein
MTKQAITTIQTVRVQSSNRLRASIVPVAVLNPEDKARMVALMQKYYDGVSEATFHRDLARKDAVILLRDANGIQGFSTLVAITVIHNGKPVRGLFSGDTVIEKSHWGQTALGKAFLWRLFVEKLRRPLTPLYWLLISKGFKTYLMMANNFAEHFPRYEYQTPPGNQLLLDAFYQRLFPGRYDATTGLILCDANGCRLKAGIADTCEELRTAHPRIAFFESANPRWREGFELACIARMTLAMPFRYAIKVLFK